MFEPDASKQAALSFYGFLKSASQVMTYLGVAATGLLSVYDLWHKDIFDPALPGKQLHLNRAGRTHLIAFLVISIMTIASTIVKDLADSKLGDMSYEKAQLDLHRQLGASFREFTKQTMNPAVDGISQRIRTETDTLHTNIDHAVKSLNSSLDQSESDIQRSAVEASLEAEVSNERIEGYNLQVEMPYDRVTKKRNKHLHRLELMTAKTKHECYNRIVGDQDRIRNCGRLIASTQLLQEVEGFIQALDPSDADPILIIFNIASTCDPLANTPESADPWHTCVKLADFNDRAEDSTHVLMEHTYQLFPPQFGFTESGLSPTPLVGTAELKDKYGRDADVLKIEIHMPKAVFSARSKLPKSLMIMEGLHLTGGGFVQRSYTLGFKGLTNDQFVEGFGNLVAVYSRF